MNEEVLVCVTFSSHDLSLSVALDNENRITGTHTLISADDDAGNEMCRAVLNYNTTSSLEWLYNNSVHKVSCCYRPVDRPFPIFNIENAIIVFKCVMILEECVFGVAFLLAEEADLIKDLCFEKAGGASNIKAAKY